jgi:hypothetical protein
MKQRWLVYLMLCLALWSAIPFSYAQTDADGDGVEDSSDNCPTEAGPASNNGCPLPVATPDLDADDDGIPDANDACPFVSGQGDQFGGVSGADGCPVDTDGDQVVDGLDRCPRQAGIVALDGCPDSSATPEVTEPTLTPRPSVTLATLPTDGDCVIATREASEVNIRLLPTAEAEVVGRLNPANLYPVLARNPNSAWWRLEEGWVNVEVVRAGGDCQDLPDEATADAGRCPAILMYSPEELARLEAAGITRPDICNAAQDAPDRVCDEVLSQLTLADLEAYRTQGLSASRLCLPEDRADAPCPLLGSLSAEQLARYQAAGVNPCGQPRPCPAVATMSSETQARLTGAGLDLGRLCLPTLPPDAFCQEFKTLGQADLDRLASVNLTPRQICTPADTLNIPSISVIEIPLMPSPDPELPNPSIFSGQSECTMPFTSVKLANSPYPGPTNITVAGTAYWGTSCNEIIFGDASDNMIIGGGGNDLILGYGGNDIILGGLGSDVIMGMNGDDLLNGTGGHDFVYGNHGVDKVGGGSGNDVLWQDSLAGDYSFSNYSNSGLLANWTEPSEFWSPGGLFSHSVADGVGISDSFLEGLINHPATIAEIRLFSASAFNVALMKGGSGSDFMEGSDLGDLMLGGNDKDYLHNVINVAICSDIFSCNTMDGESGDDFIEGAGKLIGLGDFGVDVVMPIFSAPLGAGWTQYYTTGFDVCITISSPAGGAYPIQEFTATPCWAILPAASTSQALAAFNTWYAAKLKELGG